MSDLMDRAVERLTDRVGSTYYGKYRGIVTDINDPENRGRIRATVPAVLGDAKCGWAMPAAPFAGDGFGFFMLPTVGSGVWIEFEAGRLDNPIWSGAWWANNQRPEPQGETVRVLVTKPGHKIILDEDASEITIEHGSGPQIKLAADEITLTVGACEIKIGTDSISLNNGLVKVGLAGVSLVNGGMSFGVPPT